jgi:hypothetical protein
MNVTLHFVLRFRRGIQTGLERVVYIATHHHDAATYVSRYLVCNLHPCILRSSIVTRPLKVPSVTPYCNLTSPERTSATMLHHHGNHGTTPDMCPAYIQHPFIQIHAYNLPQCQGIAKLLSRPCLYAPPLQSQWRCAYICSFTDLKV